MDGQSLRHRQNGSQGAAKAFGTKRALRMSGEYGHGGVFGESFSNPGSWILEYTSMPTAGKFEWCEEQGINIVLGTPTVISTSRCDDLFWFGHRELYRNYFAPRPVPWGLDGEGCNQV